MAVPNDILSMSKWYLTLPTGSSNNPDNVYQPALATYSKPGYFEVGSTGDCVRFVAPAVGVTTSSASGATRTELREMTDNTGSNSKSNWGFADGQSHSLTVTMTCDPTSVVGRKECIVGQIHDAGSTPPIYLAINMNSLPGALNIFLKGPSDGALLTGLQPTDKFTYRMVVTSGVDVKIYACLGDNLDNLVLKKTYPTSTFSDPTSGCYFKAGAYNKEPISTATSGSSIVTMYRLDHDVINTGLNGLAATPAGTPSTPPLPPPAPPPVLSDSEAFLASARVNRSVQIPIVALALADADAWLDSNRIPRRCRFWINNAAQLDFIGVGKWVLIDVQLPSGLKTAAYAKFTAPNLIDLRTTSVLPTDTGNSTGTGSSGGKNDGGASNPAATIVIIPDSTTAKRPNPDQGAAVVDITLGRTLIIADGVGWRDVLGRSLGNSPQNMRATVNSDNSITLAWDAVPNATTYKLYEDQSPNGVSGATALTQTSSTQSPGANRTYYYWVTALVAGVESAPSTKVSAVLPFGATPAPNPGTGGGPVIAYQVPAGMTALIDQDPSDAQIPWKLPPDMDHVEIWYYAPASNGVTAEWLGYIQEGARRWNASPTVKLIVTQDPVPAGVNTVDIKVITTGDDGNFDSIESGGYMTGGHIQYNSANLSGGPGGGQRQNVATHEMGHSIGLRHRLKPRVMMNQATYSDVFDIDDDEFKNLLFDYAGQRPNGIVYSTSAAPPPSGGGGSGGGGGGTPSSGTPGGKSIGDPYFPAGGNTGYLVSNYSLNLTYQPSGDHLSGTATITATATQDLSSFSLDFTLTTSAVTVNGATARFTATADKLTVVPASVIPNGQVMTVVVTYSGVPSQSRPGSGQPLGGKQVWFAASDGAGSVAEPYYATSWYPCNDHPSNKATWDVSVSVPSGTAAITCGELVSNDVVGSQQVWKWHMSRPTATYNTMMQIGKFDFRNSISSNGRPFIRAYSNRLGSTEKPNAVNGIERTPEVVAYFTTMYGPYPFDSEGGVACNAGSVSDAEEFQSRPVYSNVFGSSDDFTDVVHENSHMWFGCAVSPATWKDIWLNEGFATFSEWLWIEHTGGKTTAQSADSSYSGYSSGDSFWNIKPGDPGATNLLSDPVYQRGGMTLQALRSNVGDTIFFQILQHRVSEHLYGSETTDQFIAMANRISGKNLQPLFDKWLFTASRPSTKPSDG